MTKPALSATALC